MRFFNTNKTKLKKARKCKYIPNEYLKEVKQLEKTIPNWNNLFCQDISKDDRLQQWIRLKVIGEPLIEKFAWAIPNEKALSIIQSFSPLVEMGAGKGYWAQ